MSDTVLLNIYVAGALVVDEVLTEANAGELAAGYLERVLEAERAGHLWMVELVDPSGEHAPIRYGTDPVATVPLQICLGCGCTDLASTASSMIESPPARAVAPGWPRKSSRPSVRRRRSAPADLFDDPLGRGVVTVYVTNGVL